MEILAQIQNVELTLSKETSYILSQLLETFLFHFVGLSLVALLGSVK